MIRVGSRVKRKIVLENARDDVGLVTGIDAGVATVRWEGSVRHVETEHVLSNLRLAAYGEL